MDKARAIFSNIKVPEIPLSFRRNALAAGITVQIFASLLLSLFAFEKGVTNTEFIVPMLFIGTALLVYAHYVRCDIVMTLCISLLISVGTVTQAILQPDNVASIVNELWLSSFLAVAITGVFSFVENRFKVGGGFQTFVLLSGIWLATVILTILLRSGEPTNGTYAWIYFGGNNKRQFQVTSLFVPAFVLYETILYTSSFKNKWKFSLFYMLTLAGALFICNELGTLIVIFFLWIINMLVFGELGKSLKIIGVFGGLGGAAIGVCAIAKNRVDKLAQLGETAGGMTVFLSKVFNKISKRFTDWINIKSLPQYEQSAKAWRGIIRGGLLGSENEASIGHEIYDYTFAAILQRMGFLFGLIIVFLYVAFFFIGIIRLTNKCRKDELTFSGFFAVGSMLAFFVSSIIPIFTNTAFFPLIGISLPLISSGMSSGVICRFLILVVMLGCKERILFAPIKLSKAKKEEIPLVR